MIAEVRVHQFMSPLPPNLNLKNLTALELHRFVGEQMKQSTRANKSLNPLALKTLDENIDDQQKNALKKKLLL